MPNNSANNKPPAQEKTRSRHDDSPAPQKRRGFATIAGLLTIIAWLAFAAVIALLCWSAFEYYGIMTAKGEDGATATETPREAQLFRDIVILCLAAIGMGMAFWRNASLDRQSKAANKQANSASDRLHSDQFASAAEAMSKEAKDGKAAIAARIGGIYTMADLAKQLPQAFAERVVKNLIAYIKSNAQETTKDKPSHPKWRMLGDDVKTAFSVLNDILGNKAIRMHIGEGGEKALDFSYHDFHGLNFWQIDLRHYTKWTGTNFRDCYMGRVQFADGADMKWVNFYGASLREATLKGANLQWANMQGANLADADMQGCFMRNAKLYPADGGEKTIMERVKLAGADMKKSQLMDAVMHKVDLRGAVLDGANLTGVEWLVEAIFGETSMLAVIGIVKDNLPLQAQGKNVWFDNPKQTGDKPDEIEWRLEQYDDGYALAGVLINYADAPAIHKEETRPMLPHLCLPGEPENIQRQAARLDLAKLPENTPEEIREWLKEIKAKMA